MKNEFDKEFQTTLIRGYHFTGYDVDAMDDYNYSALHLAARHGYIEMIKILLKHGSKINFNVTNPEEKFPLDAIEEPLRLAIKVCISLFSHF